MEASKSRMNSINSNYSVKHNFADVPINGSNSKPFVFAASNSSRQSFGNASRRDGAAVQPGSPAASVQPSLRAQEEYVKLRNPSLLANKTAPGPANSASGLSAKNASTPAGVAGTADSGYGSVGQISRPESKAPSTISKAPSEFRKSQDLRSAPSASTGVDFLPKLDFSPEPSRPSTPSEQAATASIQTARPIAVIASRNRADSTTSSYVSRLDPGSDRSPIASSHPKPFDQIDFSKPGQQFLPSPTKSTRPMSADSAVFADPAASPQTSAQPPRPVKEPPAAIQSGLCRPAEEGMTKSNTRAEPLRMVEIIPKPRHGAMPDVEPKSPREVFEVDRQKPVEQDMSSTRNIPDEPSAVPENGWQPNSVASAPPADNDVPANETFPPQTTVLEPAHAQPAENVDDQRGRQIVQTASTLPSAIEENPVEDGRKASSSQTRSLDHGKPTTRYRNWSRPSQSSGSQLDDDRKNSSSSMNGPSAKIPPQHASEPTWQNGNASIQESEQEYRDFHRAQASQQLQRMTQPEQTSHPQDASKWNDQSSSIYGDSTYNPSTRHHSPARRQSFAPSEMLDLGQSTTTSALPPLTILDGLKVNKRGKILDEEGDPIGELVEGDIIDCVRQKANANGEVLDDYGRVVGRVSTLGRGGADVRSQSPATTVRSRGFSDYRSDMMQRYALPDSQIVSPTTPTLGKPFGRTQEDDPRQRAADLQALAARRSQRGPEAHIELDASGYAEAAPLVDHSEIFAPPFIPSRSPKRSPAEPTSHAMNSYFAPPVEKAPPVEEPRLKKWASRNLEQDREEMQRSAQAPQTAAATPVQVPGPSTAAPVAPKPVDSPLSTTETAVKERKVPTPQTRPESGAQDFISSDQPKDIFPWMTNPAPQDSGKWSSNIFTYKGEIPSEETTARARSSSNRSSGAQPSSQSAFTTSAPLMKHYMPHLAGSGAGSRKSSNRTSFREHVPHVKSPLSTHSKPDSHP